MVLTFESFPVPVFPACTTPRALSPLYVPAVPRCAHVPMLTSMPKDMSYEFTKTKNATWHAINTVTTRSFVNFLQRKIRVTAPFRCGGPLPQVAWSDRIIIARWRLSGRRVSQRAATPLLRHCHAQLYALYSHSKCRHGSHMPHTSRARSCPSSWEPSARGLSPEVLKNAGSANRRPEVTRST